MQIMMSAPQYINRLRNYTPEDQEKLQQDIARDLERFSTSVNQAIPAERKAKLDKLAFQTIGGVDSPFIAIDTLGVLNLSEDQKGKMQSIFNEMREERMAHIEAGLAMAERVIAAGGPGNLSPEDLAALERERMELETKMYATTEKLSERLRQNLTPEQLKLEQELMASRPDFLPGLPQRMQRGGRQSVQREGRGSSFYVPGAGSWQPGMPMTVPTQEPRRRSRTPWSEEE
jgi:Spy/CpxP family protein refolding chaperone